MEPGNRNPDKTELSALNHIIRIIDQIYGANASAIFNNLGVKKEPVAIDISGLPAYDIPDGVTSFTVIVNQGDIEYDNANTPVTFGLGSYTFSNPGGLDSKQIDASSSTECIILIVQ